MRLAFLVRQLNEGGAERQLVELAKGLGRTGHNITVVAFYDGGRFKAELINVKFIALNKQGRWDVMGFLHRLYREMRQLQPDVLHSYLGVPNLLALSLKPFLIRTRVVWGMRASNVDLNRYDWLTSVIYHLECALARFADLIIINSEAGHAYHCAHGFPAEKMVVIPNGIDTALFRPDGAARGRIRAEWGVAGEERLIGVVGRLDPMKDHATFLQAAALVARDLDNVRFVCIGNGPVRYRQELQALALQLGLTERLIWAGSRGDMPAVYNALDVATSSSSYGEGFPNVVGEAMSCGIPCVVTDVGDSARIVEDTGIVVPPKDPAALAEGWRAMLRRLNEDAPSLGEAARARVVSHFGSQRLMQKTAHALAGLT